MWRLKEREVLKIVSTSMAWTSEWMMVPPNEKSYVGRIASYIEMS